MKPFFSSHYLIAYECFGEVCEGFEEGEVASVEVDGGVGCWRGGLALEPTCGSIQGRYRRARKAMALGVGRCSHWLPLVRSQRRAVQTNHVSDTAYSAVESHNALSPDLNTLLPPHRSIYSPVEPSKQPLTTSPHPSYSHSHHQNPSRPSPSPP